MNLLHRKRIVTACGGHVLQGRQGPGFTAVFTDTRQPVAGALFFALDGPNFDAHSFLESAVAGGAAGLVVSNATAVPADIPENIFVLVVSDTRLALGKVAQAARHDHRGKVIAITGSVGKTTMKNMVASALRPFGKVGYTPGNLNNDIGLPLTLCGLDGDEDFVVLELGMNAPGEIAYLTSLAQPDVGLITGAHPAHLAFFPDVDAIADAKAELYASMEDSAFVIANADDPRIMQRARVLHPENLISYGLDSHATIRVEGVTQEESGISCSIASPSYAGNLVIPAIGGHHAIHAAGALAVVQALGLRTNEAATSIETNFRGEKHRMSLLQTDSGVTILDDCYNASPLSMKASLETFGSLAKNAEQRIAVLGSMLELGKDAPQFHYEAGAIAAQVGVDRLFALGPFASDLAQGACEGGLSAATLAEDVTEVLSAIVTSTPESSWLLLKGSRSGRLERVLSVYNVMEAR